MDNGKQMTSKTRSAIIALFKCGTARNGIA